MSRISLPTIVLGVTTLISLFACTDAGGTITASADGGLYVGTSDCSAYGDVCMGEAPFNGAFELAVLPLDEGYDMTLEVTFEDAIDGEDIVQNIDVYPDYGQDGQEFWIWSPEAPPEGYIKVTGELWIDNDTSIPLFCSQSPEAAWVAYNNGWEVSANDYYSSSTGCYLKVNLRDVVED